MAAKRKYPVGIQSFESIRQDGYIYVDKTPLIYKMITEGKPYFLSRPRRFGKSLLVSTLAALFEGRRDLFEAFTTEQGIEQPQLFIATTDWKWEKYPVLRFDFSASNLTSIERLDNYINNALSEYEKEYGIPTGETDISLTTCSSSSSQAFRNSLKWVSSASSTTLKTYRCIVPTNRYAASARKN